MQTQDAVPSTTPVDRQPHRSIGWGGWTLGSLTALLLAGLALSGVSASKSNPLAPLYDVLTPAIFVGATVAYMHRRFGRSGSKGFWKGFLIGIVAAFAILFARSYAVGYWKGKEERQVVYRLVSAAAVFEPSLDPILREAADTKMDPFANPATRNLYESAIRKASQVAPDATVVALDQALHDIIDPAKGGASIADCAAVSRGDTSRLGSINPGAFILAMTNLLEGASRGPRTLVVVDATKSQDALVRVLDDVDPDMVFDDEERLAATSDEELCEKYIAFRHSIHSLPVEDAAGVLRLIADSNRQASTSSEGG